MTRFRDGSRAHACESKPIPLYADREVIVASVLGSDIERADEVARFLAVTLAAAARRAELAPKNARASSARIEAGIRRAVGQVANWPRLGIPYLMDSVLQRIENRGPEEFGLKRVPDKDSLRKVLKKMQAEWKAASQSVASEEQAHDHARIDQPPERP